MVRRLAGSDHHDRYQVVIVHLSARQIRVTNPELPVSAGGKVAVTGPDGSGKTTLLNLIARMLATEILIIAGLALRTVRGGPVD